MSAVCLERYPVIIKDLSDIESKYQGLLNTMEFENSLLSDHELQRRKDE